MPNVSNISEDENKLILDFQKGDKQAYAIVFKKFYQPLCFFAGKMKLDDFEAEELVQDVLLNLWNRRMDFETVGKVKAFLYISTRNAVLNYLDKKKRLGDKQEAYTLGVASYELPISHHIIYSETLRELKEAIQTLPAQCSRIMSLLYEEGLAPNEVAAYLGITPSTVYNQKLKGVELLKTYFSKVHFWMFLLLLFWISFQGF